MAVEGAAGFLKLGEEEEGAFSLAAFADCSLAEVVAEASFRLVVEAEAAFEVPLVLPLEVGVEVAIFPLQNSHSPSAGEYPWSFHRAFSNRCLKFQLNRSYPCFIIL